MNAPGMGEMRARRWIATPRVENQWMKAELPKFEVGDTVDVEVKIKEGDKERIQVFSGTVIARRGRGPAEAVTVRRIVQGEGVERIFPLHSPKVASINVARRGVVRRAKLYYLRDRVGKATRIREKARLQEQLNSIGPGGPIISRRGCDCVRGLDDVVCQE